MPIFSVYWEFRCVCPEAINHPLQNASKPSIIPQSMNFRAFILPLLVSSSIFCAQTNPPAPAKSIEDRLKSLEDAVRYSDERLAKALSHRLRVQILQRLTEHGTASPSELGTTLDGLLKELA